MSRVKTPEYEGVYGYKSFPEPILDSCSEILPSNAPRFAGSYFSKQQEAFLRIEQCGERIIFTGGEVIHDFLRTDNSTENGADDIRGSCTCGAHVAPQCFIKVAAVYRENCIDMHLGSNMQHVVTWCKKENGLLRNAIPLKMETLFEPTKETLIGGCGVNVTAIREKANGLLHFKSMCFAILILFLLP